MCLTDSNIQTDRHYESVAEEEIRDFPNYSRRVRIVSTPMEPNSQYTRETYLSVNPSSYGWANASRRTALSWVARRTSTNRR